MTASRKQEPWEAFKAKENPLAKVREVKKALPEGPGLNSMYREVREGGTLMGVPVLTVGRNVFVPRAKIIERVEGRDARPAA